MKIIDKSLIKKLEQQKNAALKRIAERLRSQTEYPEEGYASHMSHSSGGGRTHSSYVSS